MTLEFLIEDNIDSNFNEHLPAKRRNDILTGLKNRDLSAIMDSSYSVLSQCFGRLKATPESAMGEIEEITIAMNTILGTLAPTALLASAEEMTDSKRSFADVAVYLMASDALSAKALELLSRIVRPGQVLSRDSLYSLLRSVPPVLRALHQSMLKASSTTPNSIEIEGHIYYGNGSNRMRLNDPDKVEYFKKLIDTSLCMFACNIDSIADRHNSGTIDATCKDIVQVR